MDHFNYINGELHAENVALRDIANEVGTPCYVYSRATLERHWHAFDQSLGEHPHLICYAVKANSNLGLINLLARLGSGFDVVSQGELARVLAANGVPQKTVFSGVGKSIDDIEYALTHNILCINVESVDELHRVNQIAKRLNQTAPIALRVNPDVDANTHPYISTGLTENKFGIDIKTAVDIYALANSLPHIKIQGIACHIGSQLTTLSPFLDALDRVLNLLHTLKKKGIHISHLDLGGGLGINYRDETPPSPATYAKALVAKLNGESVHIHLEPGRAIAGNAGILLTSVEYLKSNDVKNFAIVDAAMNDLLRPTLYGAWQNIIPVTEQQSGESKKFDVVGPICETGDFLGKDRLLNLKQNDLLAVRSSGAYGFVMSSNYNTRPRAAEVIVDQNSFHIVRQRESFADMIKGETLLPKNS